jgi:ribosomal protein S6--L-glutamate ligase
VRMARNLGIDHAGFDIAMVDGHPYLFEFNRLFGNAGLGANAAAYNSILLDYLDRQSAPKPRSPSVAGRKRRLARVA